MIVGPELFWIPGSWRGRLAVATRPRGGDWLEDEISGLRAAGIDVIVSLLEDDETIQLGPSDEPAAARASGIRFIAFPIPDRGVPDSFRKLLNSACGCTVGPGIVPRDELTNRP